MIHNIQMKVMNFVGLNGRTLSSPSPLIKPHMGSPSSAPVAAVDKQQHQQQTDALRALYENANNAPTFPVDPFTEKTQSFYPSCEYAGDDRLSEGKGRLRAIGNEAVNGNSRITGDKWAMETRKTLLHTSFGCRNSGWRKTK